MPFVSPNYNPPLVFRNGHFSTIYSGLVRRVIGLVQERERLELPDGDFLDLDWSYCHNPSSGVVILLHGLEGHGQRPYITGSAKHFNQKGYDACAVNFRGCSGDTNRMYRSYHSGSTEDLDAVIHHILHTRKYSEIYIKGISLGGNLALKYVGERNEIPEEIKGVIGVSVPCDLHSSLKELLKPKNYLYAERFRRHLTDKLKLKLPLFPKKISKEDIKKIKTLKDFDDIYTSRAHGFTNALDYYQKCSCLQFLPNIKIPALVINAQNDSFLGPECFPFKEAKDNPKLYLEVPKYGGHVGFYKSTNIYHNETRAIKFVEEVI